uniref:Serpentine receptor class gamma n=1 Tax=Globodera rostochiensis TaxID=31243 RepID=A0A914I071_GLORO
MQILVICRHKKFYKTFYALFVLRAIPDIICILSSYYVYRLPTLFGSMLWPIYENLPNWARMLSYFLGSYTLEAETMATTFMMLNRLTAILKPLANKRIWQKMLPISFFATISLPFLLSYEMLFIDTYLQTKPNSTSFVIMEVSNINSIQNRDNLIRAIFSTIFLFACILINLATVFAYKLNNIKVATVGSSNNISNRTNKVERKLLIYAIITFAGHALVSLLLILMYVFWEEPLSIAFLYCNYPWIIDFGTAGCSTWLLFWASDSLRKQFIVDFVPTFIYVKIIGDNGTTPPFKRTQNVQMTIQVKPQMMTSCL